MERTQGLLKIRSRPTELEWAYWANKATRPGATTQGALSLVARIRGQQSRTLVRHVPRLDQAFAVRHAKVRKRRRPLFAKAAHNFSYDRAGYVQPSAKDPEQTWFTLTYKTIHAFTGKVRIYWHPRAESALVVRIDRQELSSLPTLLIVLWLVGSRRRRWR